MFFMYQLKIGKIYNNHQSIVLALQVQRMTNGFHISNTLIAAFRVLEETQKLSYGPPRVVFNFRKQTAANIASFSTDE